jgi:hypothetical protein
MYIKGFVSGWQYKNPKAQQVRRPMKIVAMFALSASMVAASWSASLAGPCTAEIDAMMVRINAALQARVAAGPSAQQQGVTAGRHVQPTPRSIASAEEKLGGLSPEIDAQVRSAMVRARAADEAGDDIACKEALAEVQRVIGP